LLFRLTGEANRDPRNAALVGGFAKHRAQCIEPGAQATETGRQSQLLLDPVGLQQFGQRLSQQIEAGAAAGREPDPRRPPLAVALQTGRQAIDQIDLVADAQPRHSVGTDLGQHRLDLLAALLLVGVGRVDHLQQQVGLAALFEGGAKGFDQLVRQLTDETDGVGQDRRSQMGQLDAAQCGVERGEELVGGEGVGTGEGVEQGRLAAVGIADQRQHRNLATAPGAPPLGTALAHRFEPLLHPLRALPQHPLVELELGLTGTAQTNAAFLPVEVTPAAHQPAGEVLQLRQLDLQLPLMGAGAQRENDQDQPGAVEHPQSEPAFEVALLR